MVLHRLPRGLVRRDLVVAGGAVVRQHRPGVGLHTTTMKQKRKHSKSTKWSYALETLQATGC